ncbi:uncharacterized protein LOC130444443 [Diorhabda sublineata]|nr:uncharacterized protein LOC130444443 [Diorhabda sublineata]
MVDVPGEGEATDGATDTILYDPDELFMFIAPQSHNLTVQRQRLLDCYIEDLSLSEVEEAAVALRLLVNLFRQRRMDMNKLVPLFNLIKGDGQGGDLLGCGCPPQ